MNKELSQEINTTEQVRNTPNPTGKGGFKDNPQNINPGGRPKNSLKSYIATKLSEMSDEEKEQWLLNNQISGIDMWKMGEGLPKADLDINAEVTTKVIDING